MTEAHFQQVVWPQLHDTVLHFCMQEPQKPVPVSYEEVFR